MSKATIRWFDRNIDEVEQRIYRSETTMDPNNMPVPLATVAADVQVYEDNTVEDDKIYYYRVSSVRADGLERISDEITVDTAYNLGPGPDVLVGGGAAEGFFGEVPVTELFSGDELAAAIGLTAGTSQHSTEPWLKFVIDGEIIYVAKKPYRHSISWDHINAVNAVYNDTNAHVVEKDGYQFRVTLLTGASSDPYIGSTSGGNDPAYSQGSEWNRLLYRVHEDDPSGDPWVSYSNSDIVVGVGNGRASWTQETSNTNSTLRVYRGPTSLVGFAATTSDNSNSARGWRPALRLVV